MIEVIVRCRFAGVMAAAGLTERYALKQQKAPEAGASGADLLVVAGARSQCHYGNLSSMFVISGLTPAAA